MQNKALQFTQRIATHHYYWLGLFALGVVLEATALLYQYVGNFEPCILCIHIRLWVILFSVIALCAHFLRHSIYVTALAHGLVGLTMIGMFKTAWQLLQTERGNILGSCSYFLDMPEWFAIDQWFPAVFEVRASCASSPELLFGITMAESLTVFSAVMAISSLVLVMGTLSAKSANQSG